MNRQWKRTVVLIFGGVSLIAAGGCQASEESVLGQFFCDFARNALAAFLF